MMNAEKFDSEVGEKNLNETWAILIDPELELTKKSAHLQSLSLADFENFLEILEDHPQRHDLPQDLIEAIMDRGLALIEEQITNDKQPDFDLGMDLGSAIQLHGDFRRTEPANESITDKAFRSLTKLYAKHPKAGDYFFSTFSQDLQTIRPDILINGLTEMIWRPDFSQSIRDHLLQGFNYLYSFNKSEAYDQEIRRGLNFDQPENYFKTATFLEFIKQLTIVAGDYGFSEERVDDLLALLKSSTEEKKGSYLLNLRAQEIIKQLQGEDFSYDKDQWPFVFESNVYAFNWGDGFYLSSASDFNEISQNIEKLQDIRTRLEPPQELIDEAIAQGKTFIKFQPDRQIFDDYQDQLGLLINFFEQKIKPTDISPTATTQDIFDFNYLLSKPIREKVEQEFGVELAQFSHREKFYILNFLKTVPSQKVDQVKTFSAQYGQTGLKTFLACEYGLELGEKIIKLGEILPPEVAEQVFAKYNEMAIIAENISAYLEKTFKANKNYQPEDSQKISDELLRQGKEFLTQIADSSEQTTSVDILAKLEELKTDLLAFAQTFKNTHARFEDIRDLSFEVKTELDQTEIDQMKKILVTNYQTKAEFSTKVVLPALERSLDSKANEFYLLKKDGQIIGFFRLEKKAPAQLYFGSFNIDPNVQGASIGRAMLQEVLEQKSQDHQISANVEIDAPVAEFYINKLDFIANALLEDVEGTGVTGFSLVRNRQNNHNYLRQKMAFTCPPEKLTETLQRNFNNNQVLTFFQFDRQAGQYLLSFENQATSQSLAA